MSNTNDDVTRNFLLQTGTRTNALSCHYSGNEFFSYSTVFARVDKDKNTVLISDRGMTPTTSKHRAVLVHNAIRLGVKILPVPLQIYKSTFPTNEEIIGRFEARMDYLKRGTELALSATRYEFLDTLKDYKDFVRYTGITPTNYDKYIEVGAKCEDIQYIKDLQKQRREFQKQKRKDSNTTLGTIVAEIERN
jgi:hypothetical protein